MHPCVSQSSVEIKGKSSEVQLERLYSIILYQSAGVSGCSKSKSNLIIACRWRPALLILCPRHASHKAMLHQGNKKIKVDRSFTDVPTFAVRTQASNY
jgi:hypothetical protein